MEGFNAPSSPRLDDWIYEWPFSAVELRIKRRFIKSHRYRCWPIDGRVHSAKLYACRDIRSAPRRGRARSIVQRIQPGLINALSGNKGKNKSSRGYIGKLAGEVGYFRMEISQRPGMQKAEILAADKRAGMLNLFTTIDHARLSARRAIPRQIARTRRALRSPRVLYFRFYFYPLLFFSLSLILPWRIKPPCQGRAYSFV